MIEKLRNTCLPAGKVWIPEFVRTQRPKFRFPDVHTGDVSLLETEWIIENNLRPESGKLISAVVEGGEFCEIITRLCELKESPESSIQKFGSSVAGRIFELASFSFFQENWNTEGVLLSPAETSLLYSVVFPGRQVESLDLLFTGLSGITVPDGVFIAKCAGKTQIKCVVEYSASREFWSRKEAITHLFRNDFFPTGPERGTITTAIGRTINSILPQFPPKLSGSRRDFKVIYVVPDDEYSESNGNGHAEIVQTPFSRSEIRLVVEGIMQDVTRSMR